MDEKKTHYVVATGIIIKDGKYLITKRAEWEKAFPGKWTVPGGKLEVNDYINEPKDTKEHWYNILETLLKREVKEETGLDIKDIKYLTSMTFIRPDNIPVLIISLYADHLSGDVKLTNDMTDSAWVSLEEAKNYELIEGIYEELEMLDKLLKGEKIEEWKKNKNGKLRIGIDLDEVIVNFMNKFLEFHNQKYDTNFQVKDIFSYRLSDCGIGEDSDDTARRVDEFYDSDMFEELSLIEGSKEVINKLTENFEIFIINSRPLRFREKTENFLKRNLPISFEVIYSNDLHNSNGNKSKADICKELEINILIDDNKDYAKNCAEKNIKVFLLNKPWNEDYEKHGNIIKVETWQEILNEIRKLMEEETLKNGV